MKGGSVEKTSVRVADPIPAVVLSLVRVNPKLTMSPVGKVTAASADCSCEASTLGDVVAVKASVTWVVMAATYHSDGTTGTGAPGGGVNAGIGGPAGRGWAGRAACG